MRTIKLTIEYDGTHFNGWQIQDKKQRTIQGEIEKALKKVFKTKVRLYGSGRTDSGVHAREQVAHIEVASRLEPNEILRAVNASLPEDISIIKVEKVGTGFHAQYSARSKVYRYTILNRKGRSPLERHFVYFYPFRLNTALMRREAKVLVGTKDFKSFQATPPAPMKDKNTIRTIKKIKITKKRDYIFIDIEATGFLHKMVRNIVGTLLEIASNRKPKGSLKTILAAKNRRTAGNTAKAKGLCLLKVKY